MQSHGFPSVVGVIDCTHVPIKNPGGENGELFRNRKGFFSLNVQAVSNAEGEIINIVCRWPGSTHDSTIFNNSRLCSQFENGNIRGVLLGDSGYPCRPYLLTPFLNPTIESERRYNRAHILTRGLIERVFGQLKQRFRCLKIPIRLNLSGAQNVIVACACLHNMIKKHRLETEGNTDEEEPAAFMEVNHNQPVWPDTLRGTQLWRSIAAQYF